MEPTPRNVKSVKSRLDTINQSEHSDFKKHSTISKVQSHFLVPSDKLDKVTRRVIAPYAQIERKGIKEEEVKEGTYLDMNRFNVFMEDTVDLDSLLHETAMVLKTVTNSSGVFVYIVNKSNNEIVLMSQNTINPERHEVNIPIEEGKVAAAHVAATKEYLLLDDVQRDKRFAEGLNWVDAKVALCMPVVKPDGDCYAILELYRTNSEPYDNNVLYTTVSVACWAGAAVHQAQARITLQRTAHLNMELQALLQKYFCDLASIDTMLTDMLAIIKSFIGAMRSSFFIIDREHIDAEMMADMWDDGWASERSSIPRKKIKIKTNKHWSGQSKAAARNWIIGDWKIELVDAFREGPCLAIPSSGMVKYSLSLEKSPAGLAARTGVPLNVHDAYSDSRFTREVDPTTGTVLRSTLVFPITDKHGVIGVVQLMNKTNGPHFNSDDEQIVQVFVNYCSLIVHFYVMQQKKLYHENLNKMYAELMNLHLKPCTHDMVGLVENNFTVVPPSNFRSFDYHISEGSREDMPALVGYMFSETFAEGGFDRRRLADFVLTALSCYRDNPYHNAEHAFCFTHTMYVILKNNSGFFSFIETAGLMLAGLCHDLDHPGVNNNFLTLSKHPLAHMYKSSQLEHHHYFLAKKLIEDKELLSELSRSDRERLLEEIRYDILCTDLAMYFLVRAQLTPIVTERTFDWGDLSHRKLFKGILMTTSDLSGCCKPFDVAKMIAESVYEEFYDQGDRERLMGYTPLSMMDRRRKINQPAEQIQFLSVVVLPCLMLLQTIFPDTSPLIENCRKTKEGWHEEIEIRGMKLWRQDESVPNAARSRALFKSKSEVS